MSVEKLQQFRRNCERNAGVPAAQIQVSLLHVLADVCTALGMDKRQQRRVIGRQGTQSLEDFQEWRVTLKK
jgi:hypothetical protein